MNMSSTACARFKKKLTNLNFRQFFIATHFRTETYGDFKFGNIGASPICEESAIHKNLKKSW
jgi:hypothetical protein